MDGCRLLRGPVHQRSLLFTQPTLSSSALILLITAQREAVPRVNLFARVQIKHLAPVPQLTPVHLQWRLQYLKVPDRKRGHACNLGLQLDGQPVPMRRHFCQFRFWRQHRVQQRWYTDIVLKKQCLLDRQKHTGLAKTARCDHIRQQSCLACTPRACTRSPSPKRPEMPRVHPWSCL